MGRELKPIYVCDNCGTTYYDRLQIRVFKNFVYDGEQISFFINKEEQEERMLCKRCTIIELDLDTQPSQKVIDEVVEKMVNDKDFHKKLDSLTSYDDEYANITKLPTVEDLEKIINNNSWKTEVESKAGDIVENFDGNTYEITDVYPQNDEQLIIDQNLETEIKETKDFINMDDELSTVELDQLTNKKLEVIKENINSPSIGEMKVYDDGKYLILFRIDSEEQEEYLAKSCGYKNLEGLRECCGKSLMGIYISTDKYVSDLKLLEPKEVQVINKIFMGIPNIVNRVVILDSNNDSLAYIPKEDFDLQIENLPIDHPVIEEVIEEVDDGEKDITAEFLDEESEYV